MTTAEAIRGMVEALRAHAGCTHCRAHPGQPAAKALSEFEKREPLREDRSFMSMIDSIIISQGGWGFSDGGGEHARNADLDAIDRRLFGERAAEPGKERGK